MADKNTKNMEMCTLEILHRGDVRRLDEKIEALGEKTQIQFTAQEKAVAAALEGTREAINKADITTDKRFDLLSEKIDNVVTVISKSSGERQIYVTHTDLQVSLDRLQANIESTLRPVVAFMNSSVGKSSGLSAGWQFALGAFGLIGLAMGIIGFVAK